MPKPEAIAASDAATTNITDALLRGDSRVVIAKAPPGAGKTTTMRRVTRALLDDGLDVVPIVVQTNAQADDLMLALAADGVRTGRFVSESAEEGARTRGAGIAGLTVDRQLTGLQGCEAIVAPADKWVYCNNPRAAAAPPSYPLTLIDEAYQMRGDNLFRIANLFDRALAVGDPGQLDPFTIAETRRFEGVPLGPLETAAATLEISYPDAPVIELPVSWRLPASAVELVRHAFYELDFMSATDLDERELAVDHVDIGTAADAAVTAMAASGWAYLELPAAYTIRTDSGMVNAVVDATSALFTRNAHTRSESDRGGGPLAGSRVAIGAAHTDQVAAVRREIQHRLAAGGLPQLGEVVVDTANRLQGREFDVTVVWHPLAGRRDATSFHLEAGRLCVLLSRHRHGCIVVGRDGAGDLLDAHPTESNVFLNLPADCPDGWEANHAVLTHLLRHRVQG
ncbi:AAA family ATPase [Blastococcus sp. SYSU D00669]